MLKTIAGWLLPSDEKLAKSAAKKIQVRVNGSTSGKEEIVCKYATLAAELSETAKTLSNIMTDAKIEDMEAETLAALLVPLFAKARETIGV